jgi:hypothetical protein
MNEQNPKHMNKQQLNDCLTAHCRHNAKVHAGDVYMGKAARGLRAGIGEVESCLQEIWTDPLSSELLRQLRNCLMTKKRRYENMPGEEGVWECSALQDAIEKTDALLARLDAG